MKISLTTLSDNENMGTFLQIHALATVLGEQGHQVELLRYIRPRTGLWGGIQERMGKKGQSLARRISASLYGAVDHILLRRRMFRFLRRSVAVTRPYRSFQEVRTDPPVADLYMTGSDQVWNSTHNRGIDRVMYLDFAPEGKPRVAYAASFGIERIPDAEVEETRTLLGRYRNLSVRETVARRMIDELGIADVRHVLDPTLLLDRFAWSEVAATSRIRTDEPYVLIYSVEPSKNAVVLDVARKMAGKLGCKVAMLTPNGYRKVIKGVDWAWTMIGPEDFVHLFLEASFVVCSSFHGTAFSLNLNRPFLSIRPERFESRTRDILECCELPERMVQCVEFDLDAMAAPVDFAKANEYFARARSESRGYLQTAAIGCGVQV